MKVLKMLTLVASLLISGCVAYPVGPGEVYYGQPPFVVGYYNPAFGYWTGVGWDWNFYAYGHPGYGHRYYNGYHYFHRR